MANYAEQIAQLRRQRAEVEYRQQAENIVQDYQQAFQLREEAAQRGDVQDLAYV